MIKIVLWDVYGTLLTSPENGTPLEPDKKRQLFSGFKHLEKEGIQIPPEEGTQYFYNLIKAIHNEARTKNPMLTYPEIEIRDLWERMFRMFHIEKRDSESVSLIFEQTVNPVQLSHTSQEMIIFFNERRIIQGLSSNAQWYTLNELESSLGELFLNNFSKEYFFMSWILGFSKPDPLFYDTIEGTLMDRGYIPEDCLFIGDDMVNDVSEPRKRGFKAICCKKESGELKCAHDIIREFQTLAGPSE